MLTIHVLTKNNEATIARCLTSLEYPIVIGDLGSTDKTKEIAARYGTVIPLRNQDRAVARNELVQKTTTDWQLFIEPWEQLLQGSEQLDWAIQQPVEAYNLYVVQGKIITKETRLWRKSARRFVRPVYESIDPPATDNLDCYLTGRSNVNRLAEVLAWQVREPAASDIEYYLAATYLAGGKYDLFLRHANSYIFRAAEQSTAVVLTHYYLAIVHLLRNNTSECIRHIIPCLTAQPTMAEFWCVLGDAFVKINQIQRALVFYENAILLGSCRTQGDSFPIEPEKYKTYPENMIKTANLSH